MAPAHRFDVRFGPSRLLLGILGTGPSRTELAVHGDDLVMQMGWAFRATIPLSSIASVQRREALWWLGIGVHGWRGTWQVNGALGPVVVIEVDPPVRARIMSLVHTELRRLRVSVTDPDHVVSTLDRLVQR